MGAVFDLATAQFDLQSFPNLAYVLAGGAVVGLLVCVAGVRFWRKRKERITRSPCEADGPRLLQAKARGRGAYACHESWARRTALVLLGKYYPDTSTSFFLEMLSDEAESVVQAVLEELQQRGLETADSAVLQTLESLAIQDNSLAHKALAVLVPMNSASHPTLGRVARRGQNDHIRLEAASTIRDFNQVVKLCGSKDVGVAAKAMTMLIDNMPASRTALKGIVKKPVDDLLDKALRQSSKDPMGALQLHPATALPVLFHMRVMPTYERRKLAETLNQSKGKATLGVLLAYCKWRAEDAGPKSAPFLLLAEVGEPIVTSMVRLLDSEEKAHRKLALKTLLSMSRTHPNPQQLRASIQAKQGDLRSRGRAKIQELFRLWQTATVPIAWSERSSTKWRGKWSW